MYTYKWMLLLAVIIYIPYTLLIARFVCSVDASTCCREIPVTKQTVELTYTAHRQASEEIKFSGNVTSCLSSVQKDERIWLVVGVISYVSFFEIRNEIRNTYGEILRSISPGPVCLIFLVGDFDPGSQYGDKELNAEMREHGDVVRINVEERYKNLVIKSIALLKWAGEYVRHFDFLLKIDDDVILNAPNLIHKLLLFSSQTRFVMGHILSDALPQRDNISIHFISNSQYRREVLPNYINGPSYVISGDLIPEILKLLPTVPLIYVEDVFMTGVLVSRLDHVTHIGNCGFSRRKDELYGVPLSSVSVHNLLSFDVVRVLNQSVHSTQRLALAML